MSAPSLQRRWPQVAKVISTSASSLRIPVVSRDPQASWTAEGAEIALSDQAIEEVSVNFRALKGLTVLSNELLADSSPEAAALVGDGLARDIANKLDSTFFGTRVAHGPDGLGSLSGIQSVDAGVVANLDPFHEAISLAETVGAQTGAFVTSPAVALALAKIKVGAGSNTPLLGQDPTAPTRRTIAGISLLVSAAVEADTVWAIPAARAIVGMRQDVQVVSDKSAFFSSDRTAIRAVLRAGFAFPHVEAIVKVATA
ncbi:phage major capsid protein [Rhodococcus qingshengii]|uniref:phage major capsid protein n=1 Tax=Rhodococcus qingshengii TaxID=334542 RepID=UPI001C8CC022|nr:phage major capsid protein [Rhodococcus qingshengii]MBX9147975.1 phage major capsid protein [Rhodococcus qingshengii]